jgi:hypothetical protein
VLGGKGSDLGISFTASATPPSGYSNHFVWAQMLSGYTWVGTIGVGGTETCHPSANPSWAPPGLDVRYPASTTISTNDNPGISLNGRYVEVNLTFQATMYLLWNSGATNAIDVPLGSVTWSWSADAQWNAGAGQWFVASSTKSAAAFQLTSFPPTWSNVVTSSVVCQ